MKLMSSSFKSLILIALLAPAASVNAQGVALTGRILGVAGQAIAGCSVTLLDSSGLSTTSDAQGRFNLRGSPSVGLGRLPIGISDLRVEEGRLLVRVEGASARVRISLHGVSGRTLGIRQEHRLGRGDHAIGLPEQVDAAARGLAFLRIEIEGLAYPLGWNGTAGAIVMRPGSSRTLAKSAFREDRPFSLEIRCAGYERREITLGGSIQDLGDVVVQALDQCPADPAKTRPGVCGCGVPEDGCGGIRRIGTTSVWDADGEDIGIAVPAGTKAGDLLLMVLHRTDDFLPLKVKGWTRAAECYKTDNGFPCAYASTCRTWVAGQDGFCQEFDTGLGRDLAQAIYHKEAVAGEPPSYRFDLNFDGGGHPGWILLTTFRGAMTIDPVRAWAGVGNDGSVGSRFASVQGQAGDMLVLSQSFDDFVTRDRFTAPAGMEAWGYVGNSDETGFLFGSPVTATGATGARTTNGPGGSDGKDALISLTLKPRMPR